MKLIDKLRTRDSRRPFFTFEFFPPRTDEGFANLLTRISRLATLDPLAVNITWGAGGSTRERSLDLAEVTQSEYGIDTVLHLTCTNMEQGLVDDVLREAKARGIQNILALRGDPPRGEEYWIPTDPRFTHAIDLVTYIKSSPEFSEDFCVGVAAYPDGHTESEVDEDGEIEYLKAKVEAGADYIVTQLFFDVDGFLRWLKRVRSRGIDVPIVPGVMPIQSYASFHRLTKLCGTRVPDHVQRALEPIQHDDQKVKDYGVALAIDIIARVVNEGGIRGVHICTLNLERSTRKVLEGLHWTGDSPKLGNRLIIDTPPDALHAPPPKSDLFVSPIDATQSVASSLVPKPVQTTTEPGRGEINNAATWDEFTNGRFGDFKSPAFGTQSDPWNAAGLGISRAEALARWGNPKSVADVTNLFLAYLHSKISTTPFSLSPLQAETHSILPYLERLTQQGWWTVFSQPTVDGVPSSDAVFGWGPEGGYIFQKCFVEFFAERKDIERIDKRVQERGGGWVNYFTSNAAGEVRTNVPDGGRNTVTWGVFKGQEIAQSTIIDMDSFLSWKEEAFSIWQQWALFYPPSSEERQYLEYTHRERWLISITHHDYKDPEALWTFLFDD